ncbi:Peptidase S8/S53 domain-containing protein [Artemisia annua]|uniref:Peptidase S8/S53 domain-containing protein n=1 Tax=Artemisia annua TaxID=35608 RepID=A0A2U1MN35_ARTAN|nr:Peptidase S8/S53 domain-containing protein [Artemisia annua]
MLLKTISFMLILICTTIFNAFPTKSDELQTYIVHLSLPEGQEVSQPHKLEELYNSYLSKIASGSNEKPKMVYAYRRVITGFAAKMSNEQAKVMENLGGVLLVSPERSYELHTTHSPRFLGLHQNKGLWKHSHYGKGIIIALLDSGITPGHPSFNDKGIPPPPPRWKGKCEVSGCNNKLIGIRNFVSNDSAIDKEGHGTHTSSTAAGNYVNNASVFEQANGTASGMAPLAHLAMYKVCGDIGCFGSDILAGMDTAIEDGADVISLSLGGMFLHFYDDSIAIGAFTAIKSGIFVSCSAGNSGPGNKSLANEAPWILTVGASKTDRRIRTTVTLGNKKILNGEALYQPKNYKPKFRPLVYPAEMGYSCNRESLKHVDVKGKVVLCDAYFELAGSEMGEAVKEAGGAAMIIANNKRTGNSVAVEVQVLPSSHVGYREGVAIKKYLNSTSAPVATIIQHGTVLNAKSAPMVTAFSSRGPNVASPGIMKPDIVGPGVDILAAWHKSVDNKTGTQATFNIISGTSMSCPHLAGAAALLKSTHPDWSPAAIKSAIMTTASNVSLNGRYIVNERDLPADVFDIGSGHVEVSKANDPGLIFDIQPDDYIPYLCGLNYTAKQVQVIVKKTVSCSETIPEAQLNYPSFVVELKRCERKEYSRTLTNVGFENSTYTIGDISLPQGVDIKVSSHSQQLSFTALHQKLALRVIFSRDCKDRVNVPYYYNFIVLKSGKYTVRIPYVIMYK